MIKILQYAFLGLMAGTLAGLVGIGGGIMLVPALVYIFAFSQHEAQGTSLAALVPPIGLLAALRYYKEGHVKLAVAGLICIGFFFGGLIGAELAVQLPKDVLKKIFGSVICVAGLYMVFF
jgi:hypothetical protein